MVKEYLGYIDVFDDNQCRDIVSRIDNFRSDWISLYESTSGDAGIDYPPLWTLGAASYRDGRKSLKFYHKIKNRENSILLNNFQDIYDIFLEKVNKYIGDAELEKDLALPGFHIFGENQHVDSKVKINLSNFLDLIHKDGLNDMHYDFLSTKYSNVDIDKVISITIPIQLPIKGHGLCVWDDSLTEFNSYDEFAKDIISSGLYKDFEFGDPNIIPYRLGSAFCFSGMSLHQIAPIFKAYPGDRRITMQAHGLVCDGSWRLFF